MSSFEVDQHASVVMSEIVLILYSLVAWHGQGWHLLRLSCSSVRFEPSIVNELMFPFLNNCFRINVHVCDYYVFVLKIVCFGSIGSLCVTFLT